MPLDEEMWRMRRMQRRDQRPGQEAQEGPSSSSHPMGAYFGDDADLTPWSPRHHALFWSNFEIPRVL